MRIQENNVDVKINKRCRCGDVRSTVCRVHSVQSCHYKCRQVSEKMLLQFDKE